MEEFDRWLCENYNYEKRTRGNIMSRVRRANRMLKWHDDIVYQFELEQEPEYECLSSSVRSQIKKAVALYTEFRCEKLKENNKKVNKILSLFSNIGVGEALLEDIGFDVVVANELEERRANLYREIYPKTNMIQGDINDKSVFDEITEAAINNNVDIIMATPPCQGMSTAGTLNVNDERNYLFLPVLELIKKVKPNYVVFENVPLFLVTQVEYEGELKVIPEVIKQAVGDQYDIRQYVINTEDYSVPQSRERAIVLLTRKGKNLKPWTLPEKDEKIITMRDAIGHLPKLDPLLSDVSESEQDIIFPNFKERESKALSISKWHIPPRHIKRQVLAMTHTPTGKTAFENTEYYPKKENGDRVKGFNNTYKRQNWDTPAYTITMDNRKISSQNNVHPGRKEIQNNEEVYSDARALTLYEIMLLMTLPEEWPIPENASEAFVRRIIGEGIPSLFVKKLFMNIK